MVVVTIVAVAGALAPTLGRIEFCRTLEGLNVQTALELRRDGHWLIPTLEGQPRTKKPPLTAWVTAAAIRPSTVADLASADPSRRASARVRLQAESRLPALLAGCGILVATFFLGRRIGGARLGAASAAILAGTFLFLQYAQAAVIDVQLALWVAVANALLAAAVLDGRRWLGCLGGGAAVGMAFMAKGPVGLVQTIAPAVCFAAWRAWISRGSGSPASGARKAWTLPIVCGTLVALLIVVPWPLTLFARDPAGQWRIWSRELTGDDDPTRSEPFFQYILLLPALVFPWTIFMIMGLFLAVRSMLRGGPAAPGESELPPANSQTASAEARLPADGSRSGVPRLALALFLIIVPLVVMSLYKDKRPRYLLPLTVPAAILAAAALEGIGASARRCAALARVAHWAGVGAVAIGLPIAGASGLVPALRQSSGAPWYTPGFAALAASAGALIVAAGILLRSRCAMMGATLAVMLLSAVIFTLGYAKSDAGQAPLLEMADAIWAKCPDAEVLDAVPRGGRGSVDLSIYLARITPSVEPASLAELTRRERPRVAVMFKRSYAPPSKAPPGWELLIQFDRGDKRWSAFVLPARVGGPAPAR